MPQRDSDNFTYSNGLLASVSSAKWTKLSTYTDLSVTSNAVKGGTASADHCAVITSWSGDTADQYSQVTLGTVDDGFGVTVRSDGTSNFYLFYHTGTGGTWLYYVHGGTYDPLNSIADPGWTNGDTMYLEIQSTTLVCKRNGTTLAGLTSTDTNLSSGKPGIFAYSNTATADDWVAGDFGAPVGDLSGTLGEGLLGRSTF